MVSYGCLLKKKILWFDLMVVHVDGCPVDGCPLTPRGGIEPMCKNLSFFIILEAFSQHKIDTKNIFLGYIVTILRYI